MDDFGFEKLALESWLAPHQNAKYFVDRNGNPMNGDYWVREFIKPELIESVPFEIKRLFEVARGAMAYGYFFYPLYTLAMEQLSRIAEAAIYYRCKAIDPQKNSGNFDGDVRFLAKRNIISEQDTKVWQKLRAFRNAASHPKEQQIITPGFALEQLYDISDLINSLFASNEAK